MKVLSELLVLALIFPALGFGNFPTNRLMKSIRNGSVYNLTGTIQFGMDLAKSHCKQIFQWDRWNCPESAFLSQNQLLTKEFGYVQAITAAGLVYAVTKNCSQGEIETCGCDPNFRGYRLDIPYEKETNSNVLSKFGKNTPLKWIWGGCSDDVRAADQIARGILQKKNEFDVQNFVEEKNLEIGRMIVKESLVKQCRCQDTGNCPVQTCSMRLPPFIDIAQKIKDYYRRAQRVNSERFTRNAFNTASIPSAPTKGLIYLDESPDYCRRDLTIGSPGTRGRRCSKANHENSSRDERNSCRNLCRRCGFGLKTVKKLTTKKCNCKFHWCCEVTCDTCIDEIEEHYCE